CRFIASAGTSPLVKPIGISLPFQRIMRARVVKSFPQILSTQMSFAHTFVGIVNDLIGAAAACHSRLRGAPDGSDDARAEHKCEFDASQPRRPSPAPFHQPAVAPDQPRHTKR